MTVNKDQSRRDFERFVAVSAGDLLRTAYLLTWDLSSAEDLVQECLLRVARRWPRVRSMEHPTAYARRVLFNLAVDGSRRRGRQRSELGAHSQLPLAQLNDHRSGRELLIVEGRSDLAGALGLLAPRQRAVLVLRYLEDRSEAQTAQMLGCSVGTVKNTAAHALAKLRQVMVPAAAGDGLVTQAVSLGLKGDK